MADIQSTMGLAKVQYPRIIFNHPKYYLLYGLGIILPLILAFIYGPVWWALLALPFAFALFIYVGQRKGLFFDCDVNLAKVLSRKERLYAVAMNMEGAGMPPVLAVKIAEGRVPSAGKFTYNEGDYFPAICHPDYRQAPHERTNVFTLPVTCGTSNSESLTYLHETLEPQIEAFETCLDQIPKPYSPGLYYVD